ncbi:MAG: hypothetical protein AB1659_13740 [Thermodesulfobacteriota bacterium]
MAEKFQILVHRNGESVHLKLRGDFDDRAASKVTDVLSQYCQIISRIFIHTETIDRLLDYDHEKFKRKIQTINSRSIPILLTGKYGQKLSTDRGNSFCLR